MSSPLPRRVGSRYRTARTNLARRQLPCSYCGEAINYSLHHTHPQSFTLDHIVPLEQGGDLLDPANHAAAHRLCNLRKGIGPPPPMHNSEDW